MSSGRFWLVLNEPDEKDDDGDYRVEGFLSPDADEPPISDDEGVMQFHINLMFSEDRGYSIEVVE